MECDKMVKKAIKNQNRYLVNLWLTNNICLTTDVVLIALGICDFDSLKLISNHLNTNKKVYKNFNLQAQELNLILEMDNTSLIEDFKNFIEADTIVCVLNTMVSSGKSINCLKKIFELKLIVKSYHIYVLFKTALLLPTQTFLDIILKYSTKRMVKYTVSENNIKGLNLILNKLIKQYGYPALDKTIRYNIHTYPDKLECVKILNNHLFEGVKSKSIRL